MAESSSELKGTVKWFNNSMGFGFIEHTSGQDVFVHYSVIQSEGYKTLKDGEEVVYQIEEGPKGLHALNVRRAKGLKIEKTITTIKEDPNLDLTAIPAEQKPVHVN